MLYAALKVSKQVVYATQLKHALTWLVALFDSNGYRTVLAHIRHQVCLDFLVDASPWRGGGVKLVIFLNGRPIECVCLTWQETDERAIGAHSGQASSQEQWEDYRP